MKKYALLFLVMFSLSGYAQNTINNYQYVLIPERFDFSREDNQYGLNTLAKSLLEEKGFTAYFDNTDLPKELAGNKCSALKAEVTQRKALFATNLTLILKDCQGNIVFKSKEGKSREKEFNTSYNLALRDAFASLKDEPYTYNGTAHTQTTAVAVAAPAPATSAPAPAAVTAPAPAPAPVPATPAVKDAAGTLYAQAISNGYQLIDTSPKIVLTLLKTSVQDCFIAENGALHGVVVKKNGDWYFEHYKENQLVAEKLLIKF
ncbi:hypothetical protein [Chitinophaga qingshengii]|uniref:Uncharacterized protein n=1 Tax=Chitinophaga qingshengii TaxID=1569794 RepID=A0ABR7TS27_9BACT|nr:hypothetical protein [Chitinophaga qingshengii]MBC9932820.1 hypothetical protein [Chitinophaga qingshengii]